MSLQLDSLFIVIRFVINDYNKYEGNNYSMTDFKNINGCISRLWYNGHIIVSYSYFIGTFVFSDKWIKIE